MDNRTSFDRRSYVELQYGRQMGLAADVLARAYYDGYHHDGQYPTPAGAGEPTVLNFDSSDGDAVGSELTVTHRLGRRQRLMFGSEYRVNLRQNLATYPSDPGLPLLDTRHGSTVWEMSMGDEVQLSRRVAASGSLRLDYQMGFAARVTPRASLVIGPFRRTHFKALFGDALRVPSTNERFYGSSLSLQANPLLQPETIRSFEGVIEHRLDTTLSLSASAYRTDLNNLIVPVTLESGIVQLANSGVAVEGVELAAQASVHGFSGSGSYSFLRPRDAGSGYLDAAPRNLAKLRAMAPLGAHLTGALQMLWSGGVQAHNGERIDSALISNVTVTTRSLWQRVTLGASVYNLFDRKASYPVSEEHVQGSVPQYGRRFLTRLTWHF